MTKYFFYSILFTLLFSGYTCTPAFAQHAGATDGYQLVWQDLFDQGSLNTKVWNPQNSTKSPELEQYLPANVSVGIEPHSGQSAMILTAKKENYGGMTCTSGKVNTQKNMYFQYGKLEARIRIPKTANGLWPAFWFMGEDFASGVAWPACGEIDLMEMGSASAYSAGTQEKFVNETLHWGNGSDKGSGKSYTWNYSLQDTLHLYTLIWDANSIKMYIDLDKTPDPPSNTYTSWTTTYNSSNANIGYYFNKPFYIIINLAIGGGFPNVNNINNVTAFNTDPEPKMYVESVKLYQLDPSDPSYSSGQFYYGPKLVTGMLTPESEPLKIGQDDSGNILVNVDAEALRSIALYNISGQKMLEVSGTNIVYTSSLPAGYYIVKIQTNAGKSESFKFMKK